MGEKGLLNTDFGSRVSWFILTGLSGSFGDCGN
jgi:hypothetical protein